MFLSSPPLRARVGLDLLPFVPVESKKLTLLPTTPTGFILVDTGDRVYDSSGRWWSFYLPEGVTPALGAPLDHGYVHVDPTETDRSNGTRSSTPDPFSPYGGPKTGIWWNGYLFYQRFGPHTDEGGGLFSSVSKWVEENGPRIVIGIVTAINPAVGIASAAVYTFVYDLSKGVKLTDAVTDASVAAAQAKSGSISGSSLIDQGLSLVRSGASPAQISAALAEVAKLGGEDLQKAFATGVALAQAQEVQKKAIAALRSKLLPSKQVILDTALANGGTLIDASLGLMGDKGASAMGEAIAQSKQAVVNGAPSSSGEGSGGGGSSFGLGAVALVLGLGFLGYRALKGRR